MAWAMGYLGRAIGKLAASTKPGAASGGGGGASFPDNATSANEFLILFI